MMFGRLNSMIVSSFLPGHESNTNRKVSFHFYFQPLINLVGYDATMQGGLFNHSSPYTIPGEMIEHITWQANYGAVLEFNSVYLEYFQTAISKEFETGLDHKWGGVRIGVKW